MSEPIDRTYRFQPAPSTYAACVAAAVMVLIVSAVFMAVYLVGIGSVADVLWVESFCLAFALMLGFFGTATFRLGAGISLSRDMLVVQKWPSTNRIYIPWEDIASIRMDSWSDRPPLTRLYYRLGLGPYSSTPFVTIKTRKMVTMPLLLGRITTRRLGFPAGKLFRCYLADPEGFLRHANQLLAEKESSIADPPL
jgi:hypothetical protein